MAHKLFSNIPEIMEIPDLLEGPKKSFAEFLQMGRPEEKRKHQGLQATFEDIFPITNADETTALEFVSYTLGEPTHSIEECREKNLTYELPLKVKIRLVNREKSAEKARIKQICEQEIYLCDLPLMTENCSFIINGAERAVVNQLHRSPGIIFKEDEEKEISSYGKKLYVAQIIPYRGSWIEYEFDLTNALFIRLNKKRKFPATVFLRFLGWSKNSDILKLFYEQETIKIQKSKNEEIKGLILAEDVVNPKTGELLEIEKGDRAGLAGKEITLELLRAVDLAQISTIRVVKKNLQIQDDVSIINTLKKDSTDSKESAIVEIFKKLRPYDFMSLEMAEKYIEDLFFNPKKYDLGKVGRYKINKKMGTSFPLEKKVLLKEDIVETMKYLLALNNGLRVEIDDIDNLSNRRVRGVGELLENQFRIGLSHLERLSRDRLNLQKDQGEPVTPQDLINPMPVVAILRKFFGTSQLSQFMDQTNPLAELTHKRRLSALGPGGLSRKRAGFEVRDVHYTHYGRICPIETPEGPNIGLIASLSTYGQINDFGFIESPYRKVENKKVTNRIEYLSADVEEGQIVAQANAQLDPHGNFKQNLVLSRHKGNFPLASPEEITYMDISPKQAVSISTALIPFLEHDDANRALMGSNMQRQAVPLLFPAKPLVSTGIEGKVACDSGTVLVAREAGTVLAVDGNKIIIEERADGKKSPRYTTYELRRFRGTNQGTCVNQRPLVKIGDRVSQGQAIADGLATDQGELALGRNVLVSFLCWEGYNFEDAILISERLVKDEFFTSVRIREFEVETRDLKIRAEEFTRDIPNVGEEFLANLDENGLVRLGTEVKQGDILVGKVTPREESLLVPEERLLQVIFGKKAQEVKDASLYVPPGEEGKVIKVCLFSRKEGTRHTKSSEVKEIKDLRQESEQRASLIKNRSKEKIEIIKKESKNKNLSKRELENRISSIEILRDLQLEELEKEKQRGLEQIKKGDVLPPGVSKMAKVYVASSKKLQVGDKLAGRHGNKGVVAKILRAEDMPYLADGTPIDVLFSPLSVPSRMNVGQLLETMLGWAAHELNLAMVSPVFDGAKEPEIREMLRKAKLPEDSKVTLYDGRTGEPFAERVTVGYMYLMKLIHLVEDKIHARSIGPYALITRQPLGGKSQFGGQRFGEMEVWAIEGYGAAYSLQEFLTVKSDDVEGRTRMYESIIKGEVMSPSGTPEAFRVMIKELQALGLNVELFKKGMPTTKKEKR